MEAWTEQTSLRLLELIASTSPTVSDTTWSRGGSVAAAASMDSEGPGCPQRPGRVLRSLAASDDSFAHWLNVHTEHVALTSAQAPSVDGCAEKQSSLDRACAASARVEEHHIDQHWLAWLAELDSVEIAPESSADLRQRMVSLIGASARRSIEARKALLDASEASTRLARKLAYDMAYGLSHELNNPLANIASRARLLAEEEPNERKQMLLAAIVDQAMRGCEMIADLMLFARPPLLTAQRLDLTHVAHEVTVQARHWIEARQLELQVTIPDHEIEILADRSALREALWALLRNAIEAAEHKIDFRVALESTDASVLERLETEVISTGPATGRMAAIEICDDGPGLSAHALAHAFHPYYSGREAGRGLGLGLSKVERLAKISGGDVQLHNLEGTGCCARLFWPCAQASAGSE